MQAEKIIKTVLISAVGLAATLVANWADDRKMDEMISEKVNEALANQKEN